MHKPVPMDWKVVFDYQNPAPIRRHDKRLKEWADAVKARDGYACAECGSTDGLHAHHVKPKSLYPDDKYVVDNGVTLCIPCHAAAHGGALGAWMMGKPATTAHAA